MDSFVDRRMIYTSRTIWILLAISSIGCSISEHQMPDSSPDVYVVLNEGEFKIEYEKAFKEVLLASEREKEAFRSQIFDVQTAVEEALAAKWEKETDFEVTVDFDYCFHTCGGIYSERIICPQFVHSVLGALKNVDPKGQWTYHSVLEIATNHPNPKTAGDAVRWRGEIFFRAGKCFINSGRVSREDRLLLGCKA